MFLFRHGRALTVSVLTTCGIFSISSGEPLDWLSIEAILCFLVPWWSGRLSRRPCVYSERCFAGARFNAFVKSVANDQDWQAVKDTCGLTLNRYTTRDRHLSWHYRKQCQTSNGNLCLITGSINAIRLRVGGDLAKRSTGWLWGRIEEGRGVLKEGEGVTE